MWNLISLCHFHHEWVHRVNYPKWFLHLMALTGLGAEAIRSWMRHGLMEKAYPQLTSCLSCERRQESGFCELWEHPVDWDYSCDYWRMRPLPSFAE